MAYKIEDYNLEKYLSDLYCDGKARDLGRICDELGIDLYSVKFNDDNLSGLIERTPEGKWAIYVNATDSPKRKRFTIAHELGHYFSFMANKLSKKSIDNLGTLEDRALLLPRSSDSSALNEDEIKREGEANFIAANLLMPENLVDAAALENKNIEEMAEEFGVSESAMGFRLQNLGLWPIEGISANNERKVRKQATA